MSELTANDYSGFLIEVKDRIRRAQYQALRTVTRSCWISIGISANRSTANRTLWAGANPWWKISPVICKPNFQGETASPPVTYGT